MPSADTLLTVILAGLALSVTPGPSMLYVLSRSVGQSRLAGLASALGLGLGGVLLAIATALGLGAAFAAFDWIAPTLRTVGALYLVWLGVWMICDARPTSRVAFDVRHVSPRSFSSIVWQGIWIELLNPKTVLFFTLFLPPFVEAGAGDSSLHDVQLQLLVLGIAVPLTAVPSDLLVAWLGGTASEMINRNQVIREGLAWVGGLTLVMIAMNLYLGVL